MWKVNSNFPNINKTLRNFRPADDEVDLDKSITELRSSNHFKRAFPKIKRAKPLPIKYVYNDYHTKNTGPGYSRNLDGKPFSK